MADDYEDGSEQVFTAVIAIVILVAVTAYLIYAGVIHDLLTSGIAAGILILYVIAATLLAPFVIASGPTKSQSGYDQSNYETSSYSHSYYDQAHFGSHRRGLPPLAYLFAIVMPGYFIGQSVLWAWRGIFGGGEGGKR